MGLTSFFKRKAPGDAPVSTSRMAPTFDAVEKVRTRTRQRLIGAVVLLTMGVIGFPLVFESQPRPIPIDIPIDIPRQDAVSALVLPAPRRAGASAEAPASHSAIGSVAAGVVRESPADLMPSSEPAASTALATPSVTAPSVTNGKTEVVPAKPTSAAEPPIAHVPASAAKASPVALPATASAANAAPASAAEGSARFVVQVGAFADPAAARELRSKMEKLGLRTYTQVAETSAGKRIRVRLGPFATRAEADKAQARSKDAGIAAVVLTL
ncbi:MAG: SPOR domain-containing protein [Burkholderiaceae bacterium]|nr:SPOR domain-containing protein [Burkholderiaceae bacterium]